MLRFDIKSLILSILFLMSQPLKAQWRLIYKSQDIDSIWAVNKTVPVNTENPIVLIERRGVLSRFLIVRYAHSKRKLVNTKNVWGFTDSTNAVWRYSGGDFCRVVDYNGAGVKYAIRRTTNGYLNPTESESAQRCPCVYYVVGYSRTLDSKIETNWEKAMEDIPPDYMLQKKINRIFPIRSSNRL